VILTTTTLDEHTAEFRGNSLTACRSSPDQCNVKAIRYSSSGKMPISVSQYCFRFDSTAAGQRVEELHLQLPQGVEGFTNRTRNAHRRMQETPEP